MSNQYHWLEWMNEMNRLLKFKTTPIGIKLLEKKEELEGYHKLRRPPEGKKFYACQFMAQAARLNFSLGFTIENLAVAQCAGVLGLCDRKIMESAKNLTGVWFLTDEDTLKHQKTMYTAPNQYEAVVVAPLSKGVIEEPDVCLFYGTPGQIILLVNGLQYKNYERVESSLVGESTCSDSWGRTLATGKPGATVPCYGERRFGGVPEEEMIMAMKPWDVPRALEGLNWLYKNGIRFPIQHYGIQHGVKDTFCKQ